MSARRRVSRRRKRGGKYKGRKPALSPGQIAEFKQCVLAGVESRTSAGIRSHPAYPVYRALENA
ncbi:hypothetical protein JCM12107_11310 [Corynebacterium simulans]